MPKGKSPSHSPMTTYIALLRWQREHEHAPSVRDLVQLTGINSTCTIHRHLKELEERGLIKREPGLARTVRVVVRTAADLRPAARAGVQG